MGMIGGYVLRVQQTPNGIHHRDLKILTLVRSIDSISANRLEAPCDLLGFERVPKYARARGT